MAGGIPPKAAKNHFFTNIYFLFFLPSFAFSSLHWKGFGKGV
jgi:hypothetical protein